MLRPRSVAVVGASADPRSYAGRTTRTILKHTRPQALYLVNPSREAIEGISCQASLRDIGAPVDLAIISVPAPAVPGCLADCASSGVTTAYVISAGFAETRTAAGQALDGQVRGLLAATELRLGGPNGEGAFDLWSDFAFGFSPALSHQAGLPSARPGNIAIISQSGGAGFGLFSSGVARGLGFSRVISTGNETDVDALDYAEYCLRCDDTDVVFLYVEGFTQPGRVRDIAREALDRDKALVVLKVGRSEAARRAMVSHTGKVAGPHQLYSAVFERYGIAEVRDAAQALDVLTVLSRYRSAPGSRTAVISASGGSGLWLAEALGDLGVTVPAFTEEEQEAAAAHLPAAASPRNPVDITAEGARAPGKLTALLTAVLDFSSVDLAIYVLALAGGSREALTERLAPVLAARTSSAKPLLLFCHYHPGPDVVQLLADLGIPWFTSQAGAGRAVAALALRGAARGRRPPAGEPVRPGLRLSPADCADELALKTWLADRGFSVPDRALARSAAEAAAALGRLGPPAAMKLTMPGLRHKSDIGAVALGVSTPAAAAAAYERLSALLPGPARVLVERMAEPGRELLAGVVTDPELGAFLVLGLGGTDADLGLGTVIWPVPVTPAEARAMVDRLPVRPALGPWRGAQARDVEALVDLLVRMSEVASANSGVLAELEFNPVILHAAGRGLDIVDALAVARSTGDPGRTEDGAR